MKREFGFPLSPGLARRMIQIARCARLSVDQSIIDLAGTGWLTDDDFARVPFDISSRHKLISQQIVDHNFRCILPTDLADPYMPSTRNDDFNREAAMIAAKIGKHDQVTVITYDPYRWGLAAKKYQFSKLNLIDQSKMLEFILNEDQVAAARKGLLMMELEPVSRPENDVRTYQAIARDFSKTLLILRPRTPLPYAGEIISPGGANRYIPYSGEELGRNIMGRADQDFAPLMGVITELLNSNPHDLTLPGCVLDED